MDTEALFQMMVQMNRERYRLMVEEEEILAQIRAEHTDGREDSRLIDQENARHINQGGF